MKEKGRMTVEEYVDRGNRALLKAAENGLYLKIDYFDEDDFTAELKLCRADDAGKDAVGKNNEGKNDESLKEKTGSEEDTLRRLLENAVDILDDGTAESLLILTKDRKNEDVLEDCGFFYEISDYIFAYSEKNDIIESAETFEASGGEMSFASEHVSCTLTEGRKSVFISDVFVEEKYRRQGHASALLDRLKKKYSGSGKELLLHTDSENEPAVRLYKKAGFEIKEERHSYRYIYE